MPTVALTEEFLGALERMPLKVQRKIRTFLTKFRTDPTSSGINYEKIQAADPRVRTVRIGIDYRGIVLHPDEGDVYILAYIDHHDEAMAWAARKRFDIHPRTGALQVITTTVVEEAEQALATAPSTDDKQEPGLFASLDEDQLFDLGIPKVLLPAIAAITTEAQLDEMAPLLPAESSEALYGLAAGMGYDEVVKEIDRQLAALGDFATALTHPDTQRRIAVVDDDASLQAMLDAPLASWRVFLHPTQRKLVTRRFKGSAKVTGGAGTGKTVVAMHRAVHLANTIHTAPTDRILFTTFTKNLAQAVGQQIRQLDESAAERIAVRNLHSVAHEVLRQAGMTIDILSADDERRRWDDAISDGEPPEGMSDPDFYRKEFEDVVLAQGITSADEYLRARRIGRRGRLGRPQRAGVWSVLSRFTELCENDGRLTYPMMVAKAADVLAGHHPLPYRALIVDESQDLTASDWRFIRTLVPEGENDIFLVGDAHQRIYGKPVVLSRCGINVRGNSRRLRVNYRTTQEIRGWACGILDGLDFDDLDGEGDSHDGYTSLLHGPQPQVLTCATLNEQLEQAVAYITALTSPSSNGDYTGSAVKDHAICGTVHNHAQRSHIIQGLRERGLTICPLDKTVPKDSEPGIRIATMHRVKGLEFAHIIIFDAHLSAGDTEDPRDRCLYHVAATRARDGLLVLRPET